MAQDLLEPELLYKRELKDKHHQTVVDYFKELSDKSGVNKEENVLLCDNIYAKQKEAKRIDGKLQSSKGLRTLFIVMIVLGAVLALFSIIAFIAEKTLVGIILVIVGIALLVGGILLIVLVAKKRVKLYSEMLAKLNAEIEKMISEAYSQMAPLNSLFDDEIPATLMQKTTPLIKMDRIFDVKKLEFLTEQYGYEYKDKDNCSKVAIQSGSILGNPFAFFKELEMNIIDYTYEGSLLITWTTTVPTKNGVRTVTHTQTLIATVTKPKPVYSLDTYLMYANEAAPHLSFSRRPSDINTMDEKDIEKYVRKHEKDLTKLAEQQMKKGGNYTPL